MVNFLKFLILEKYLFFQDGSSPPEIVSKFHFLSSLTLEKGLESRLGSKFSENLPKVFNIENLQRSCIDSDSCEDRLSIDGL